MTAELDQKNHNDAIANKKRPAAIVLIYSQIAKHGSRRNYENGRKKTCRNAKRISTFI
jgi:hypothetical protein